MALNLLDGASLHKPKGWLGGCPVTSNCRRQWSRIGSLGLQRCGIAPFSRRLGGTARAWQGKMVFLSLSTSNHVR